MVSMKFLVALLAIGFVGVVVVSAQTDANKEISPTQSSVEPNQSNQQQNGQLPTDNNGRQQQRQQQPLIDDQTIDNDTNSTSADENVSFTEEQYEQFKAMFARFRREHPRPPHPPHPPCPCPCPCVFPPPPRHHHHRHIDGPDVMGPQQPGQPEQQPRQHSPPTSWFSNFPSLFSGNQQQHLPGLLSNFFGRNQSHQQHQQQQGATTQGMFQNSFPMNQQRAQGMFQNAFPGNQQGQQGGQQVRNTQ